MIPITYREEVFNINFFEVNLNDNFSSILDSLLLGCRVIILVYDLSNELSYLKITRLINKIEELKNTEKIFKIIIGNKTDLREDRNLGIAFNKFYKIFCFY